MFLLLLFTGQFNTLQDQIIGITNLGDLQEGDLYVHLLYFGIHHAKIRSFIGLFATADWPTWFPWYTLQFQSELEELMLLCTILWHCPMLPPTAEACSVGFGGAHIHLITCCNEGVLDNDVLTCGLFWLDIMSSATFEQQAIAYVLPSINNTCYHHRTPQQLPAQQQPSRYLIWFRWRCSAASSIPPLISLQT